MAEDKAPNKRESVSRMLQRLNSKQSSTIEARLRTIISGLDNNLPVQEIVEEAIEEIRQLRSGLISLIENYRPPREPRITISKINKYFEDHGREERLIKIGTSGLIYQFVGGRAEGLEDITIVKSKLSDRSLSGWLDLLEYTVEYSDEGDI